MGGALLTELRGRGIEARADGDSLVLRPRDAIDADLRARVAAEKPAILAALLAEAVEGDAADDAIPVAVAAPQWRPFPVEVLPEPYASYVADVARARQCDPAAVALPLLAALAGTIGNARTLRVGSDWYAPSVLWAAVAAPSGAVKSPPFRAALAPAEAVDRAGRETWEQEHGTPAAARLAYDAELADWRRQKADRGAPPEPPPPVPRLIVEDTTLQALAAVLAENPRGLLLARDELSGWVRSFDQFTGATGADLARWLEIYGAGSLRVDRKVDGHVHVRRAAVSVTGTIQTAVLGDVFGADLQAAGLLARFLLAMPPEPRRKWDAIRESKEPDMGPVVARFAALRSLDLPAGDEQPRALALSVEADDLYGEWFAAHEARRRDAEPGPWRAALAKLEETPGRLALVLALARAEAPAKVEAVDGDTMRRALALADWFRAEGERVYSILAESPQERADRELVAWVADHGDVTPRELARGPRRYRVDGGPERAEADLLRLVAAGRLTRTERQGRRGPAVPAYRVADPATLATATGFRNPQRENGKPVAVATVTTPTEGEL